MKVTGEDDVAEPVHVRPESVPLFADVTEPESPSKTIFVIVVPSEGVKQSVFLG